jgi:hypothetical protein
MPKLHAHGVELVVDLLDAADHIDNLSRDDLRDLLTEAADVLGNLLRRDNPQELPSDAALSVASAGEAPKRRSF